MTHGRPDANSNDEGLEEPGPITELYLRLVRLYTYYTPVRKGKFRIYLGALSYLKTRPRRMLTRIRDGRRFYVDLTTGMQETLFFVGEYERAITEIVSGMINDGDTCIDVGANFGWYSTLMSMQAGASGEVHAFEPVPNTFAELRLNTGLAQHRERIFINNCALGDREGTVTLNLFAGQPTGHASMAAKSFHVAGSYECPMITLDTYMSEKGLERVDLVKVDIEGAELLFLKGARRLFEHDNKPILLMEMAYESTREFGYLPNDLVEHVRKQGEYSFYRVDESKTWLIKIDGFSPDDIGANVFCIPKNASERVKQVVGKYEK